ncbi:MAG: arylsulfatase A-like enzyme [Planctomycetota bacterium]|jgi:arylsulfatase A-like enzyme
MKCTPTLVLLWSLLSSVALAAGQAPKRMNLVVILADDLGAETLGCYGGESYATPNLDRLAREGVLFENAFTQPLCTPTRVETLTGRSNARNYRGFSILDPSERTFAHELKDAGYQTFAVGKWQLYGAEHYGKQQRGKGTLPQDAGFDHHALWQVERLGKRHWGPTMTFDGETFVGGEDQYGPDLALQAARGWIDEAGEDPFLLFWPMILPHDPFIAPPYGDAELFNTKSDPKQFGPTVEYLDSLVGRLVNHLEVSGLAENTLLLFIGDNGTSPQIRSVRNGKSVKGDKKQPTDAGCRVPFLAFAPGRLEGGQRIADPVSTVDVFATLLDAADVAMPTDREFDGWSFLPRLDGSTDVHREWVNFHYRARPVSNPKVPAQRWCRDGRWQLFEDGRLFDTLEDPTLKTPLEQEQLGVVRKKLRTGLDKLPWPVTPEVKTPKGVILIMADDLGWGDVGFNRAPEQSGANTPCLDAMAGSGVVFDHFYSASPVCSPTRASVLTGRHPYRYGVRGANSGHLPAAELSLGSMLSEAGWRTGHFGKWHLGTLTKTVKDSNRGGPRGIKHFAPPWQRGFGRCFSTEAKVPTWDPMKDPKTGGAYGTAYWNERGERVTENLEGDDSRIIMDRALPFVRDAVKADEPYLAVIWFHTPHLPVIAGPADRKPYAHLPEDLQHYYGAISAMDREIGRLRDALRELGVLDDTLLWFCSDNGPEGKTGAPGVTSGLRGRKRDLYEGGVRVPAILEWPAGLAGGERTELCGVTSDILPTLLPMLDMPYPSERPLDGVDLLPMLQSGSTKRPPIAFESHSKWSYVAGTHKIIYQGKAAEAKEGIDSLPFLLFDLAEDRGEGSDLAADASDRVVRLRKRFAAWRASCARSAKGADYGEEGR